MSKVLVDRELLEYLADLGDEAIERMGSYLAEKHGEQKYVDAARAILAQPAEVEGVELVPFWVLFDATTPEPLIKKHMPEGVLAFFDNEEDARRAKALHPGTDYKRAPYVRAAALSAATAERDRLLASKLYWVAPAGSGLVRCVTDERYRKFSPSIRAKYDPVCCVDAAMAAKEA